MEFLNFLKDYYYLIVLILILVVLVIELILSFRVKPNQNVLSFIDKIIPELVIAAEEKYGAGHGDDKFLMVLRNVATSLSDVFNIQNIDKYESYVSKAVDKVLSCPQKKEVN